MRNSLKNFSIIALLHLFLLPSVLLAGEIRIVDERGLLRAVRSVKSKGEVKIKSILDKNSKEWPSSLVLSSADGVASDIEARGNGNGNYSASGIEGGTWKILTNGKGIIVTNVSLIEVP